MMDSNSCCVHVNSEIHRSLDRPCGFVNGQNRCFINSTLQMVFASEFVRRQLCKVRQHCEPALVAMLLHTARGTKLKGRTCLDSGRGSNEERLACTLEVMESNMSVHAMIPHLILNRYYQGRQEDAARVPYKYWVGDARTRD